MPRYEAEAKERQKEHGNTAPGKKAETLPELVPEVKPRNKEAAEQAAAVTGANSCYVKHIKRIHTMIVSSF